MNLNIIRNAYFLGNDVGKDDDEADKNQHTF